MNQIILNRSKAIIVDIEFWKFPNIPNMRIDLIMLNYQPPPLPDISITLSVNNSKGIFINHRFRDISFSVEQADSYGHFTSTKV